MDACSKANEIIIQQRTTLAEQKAEIDRLRGLERFIDDLEWQAKELPLGHEDVEKGKATYNWWMWFVRQARAALEGGEDGN